MRRNGSELGDKVTVSIQMNGTSTTSTDNSKIHSTTDDFVTSSCQSPLYPLCALLHPAHLNNGQSQHNDKQDRRRRAGRTRVKKLERLLPYEESSDVRRIVGTPSVII